MSRENNYNIFILIQHFDLNSNLPIWTQGNHFLNSGLGKGYHKANQSTWAKTSIFVDNVTVGLQLTLSWQHKKLNRKIPCNLSINSWLTKDISEGDNYQCQWFPAQLNQLLIQIFLNCMLSTGHLSENNRPISVILFLDPNEEIFCVKTKHGL